MNKESIIVLEADPNDPEDRPVSLAGLERGLLARSLRMLRVRMGLSIEAFAGRYDIPAHEYEMYEQVRLAPPPAVMAYLKVIAAEPDMVARAVAVRIAA